MSIAEKLTKLNTDITNAYNSIETKGGTIPTNKNTENLVSAIESIKSEEKNYTELEYIESTGTQYIDTGVIPTSKTKWVYDYQFLTSTSAENNAPQNGCGATDNSKRFVITYLNARFLCSIGVNGSSDVAGDTNRHTFILDAPNKQAFIDNTTISCPYTSFSATETICFFTRKADGNVSTYRHAGKLYNSQIYENNVLVRDLIPVLDENNVACLYDKVTKTYFYNQGTGSFIAGDGQLVNYTMLYDNGDECTDITGGWTTQLRYDIGNKVTIGNTYIELDSSSITSNTTRQGCSARTNNTINFTGYSLIGVVFDFKATYNRGLASNFLVRPVSNNSTDWNVMWGSGVINGVVKISEKYRNTLLYSDGVDDQFSGVGASNLNTNYNKILATVDVDLNSLYHSVISYDGCRALMYAYFLLKSDDWQALAEKAGITATSIDDLLINSTTLLSNKNAIEFMIKKCTGDFMVNAIQSETFLEALNNSPYKTKIYANTHWAKFLTMVA